MNLPFRRNRPVDAQYPTYPVSDQPQTVPSRRSRPLVAALLSLVLLAFIGWWVYATFIHDSPAQQTTSREANEAENKARTNTPTTKTTPAPSGTNSQSGNTSTGSTVPANGSHATVGGSTATTGQTAANNDQLTNTGPGETAAVFAIATLGGVVFYQIKLRKNSVR